MHAATRCSMVSGTVADHADTHASTGAKPASNLRMTGNVVIERDSTTFARRAEQGKLPQGAGTASFLRPNRTSPVDNATPQTMTSAHISIQDVISSCRKMAP